MKNKLSILVMVMTVFITCMLGTAAFAKSVDVWADEAFNFKTVQAVTFDNVEFPSYANPAPDDLTLKLVAAANTKAIPAAKLLAVPSHLPMPDGAIKFKVTIETWDSSEQWHEPYTTKEKRKATREVKKSNGQKVYETYTYEVPVEHPGYYTYWSHVQVRYDGYTKDDKLVYTLRESRNREDAKAHVKMYERITKDFLTQFAKLTK